MRFCYLKKVRAVVLGLSIICYLLSVIYLLYPNINVVAVATAIHI
jgi:hypothetical protein